MTVPPSGTSAGTEQHRWAPQQRRLLLLQLTLLAAAGVALVAVIASYAYYHGGRDRREYEAILKNTLDKMVTAQEGFFYDSAHYARSLRSLPTVHLGQGVEARILAATPRTWSGMATHNRLPGRRCFVWVGAPPAVLPPEARAPDSETKPLCFDSTAVRL
jgi:hypothetical protein